MWYKVPILVSHRYKYAKSTYIMHPSAFNKINFIKIGFMPNYKIHMLQKQKTHFDSYLVRITLACLNSLHHFERQLSSCKSIMTLCDYYCQLIIGPSRRLITSNKRTANKILAKEYNNYGMHYTKAITFNITG